MLDFLTSLDAAEPDWESPDADDDEHVISPVETFAVNFRGSATGTMLALNVLPWETIDDEQYVVFAEHFLALSKIETQVAPSASEVATWMAASGAYFVEGDASEFGQLALAIGGAFAPSKTLAEFWVRGVRAAAKRVAEADLSGLKLAYTETQLKQEFAKNVLAVLGMIAQQLRYEEGADSKVTQSGRFDLRHQIELCDQFLIIPDEAGEFLSMLRDELLDAFRRGARFKENGAL